MSLDAYTNADYPAEDSSLIPAEAEDNNSEAAFTSSPPEPEYEMPGSGLPSSKSYEHLSNFAILLTKAQGYGSALSEGVALLEGGQRPDGIFRWPIQYQRISLTKEDSPAYHHVLDSEGEFGARHRLQVTNDQTLALASSADQRQEWCQIRILPPELASAISRDVATDYYDENTDYLNGLQVSDWIENSLIEHSKTISAHPDSWKEELSSYADVDGNSAEPTLNWISKDDHSEMSALMIKKPGMPHTASVATVSDRCLPNEERVNGLVVPELELRFPRTYETFREKREIWDKAYGSSNVP